MSRLERSIHINASPTDVWRILSDIEKFPSWMGAGLLNVTISSTIREGVGVTFFQTADTSIFAKKLEFTNLPFKQIVQEGVITKWVPNEQISVEITGKVKGSRGKAIITHKISPEENGCRLFTTWNVKIPFSVLGLVVDKLKISTALEQVVSEQQERLKIAAEGQPFATARLRVLNSLWKAFSCIAGDGLIAAPMGYTVLISGEAMAPGENMIFPAVSRICEEHSPQIVTCLTDLPIDAFHQSYWQPLGLDLKRFAPLSVNLSELPDASAKISEPVKSLSDVSIALSKGRQLALNTGRLPLILFYLLDPLILKFGENAVARFIYDATLKARAAGSIELYCLHSEVCNTQTYAYLASCVDAVVQFRMSQTHSSALEVSIPKARGTIPNPTYRSLTRSSSGVWSFGG